MNRLISLDAFRGAAILLMVLSGSIAFGPALPAWMFHAQVPPPYHVFKPELPGITWVDLVFPFFLFSMGAAFPLALYKKAETQSFWQLLPKLLQRFVLLVFFALFTMHARAWIMSKQAGLTEYLLSIACFLLLFLIYTGWENFVSKTLAMALKAIGLVLAVLFMYLYPFAYGKFSLSQMDIIILVLANMALFGSLIWYFTRKQPLWRIAVLPLVMAVFLSGKDSSSWNSILFNWSPAAWMYKFYYLKYLFIIIPGTFAGDWLLQQRSKEVQELLPGEKKWFFSLALLCFSLLFVNLWGLYVRSLVPNLVLNLGIAALMLLIFKKIHSSKKLYASFLQAGLYLLILGLFFEAYEGGIKKDYSTYSYYFCCCGLAFLSLLALMILEKLGYFRPVLNFLAANGKNPMIAYTAGNLLLIPVLKSTGSNAWLDLLNHTALNGFLRGLIFTGMVSLITILFTRIQLFWKT